MHVRCPECGSEFVDFIEDIYGENLANYDELNGYFGYYECCSCGAEFYHQDPNI